MSTTAELSIGEDSGRLEASDLPEKFKFFNISQIPDIDEYTFHKLKKQDNITRPDAYFQTDEFLAFSEPSFEMLSRQEYLDCMKHHEEVIRYHKLFDRILGTLEEYTDCVRGRSIQKTDTDVLIEILKNWINEATMMFKKEDAILEELDSDRKAELIAEAKKRTKDAIAGFEKRTFILNERLALVRSRCSSLYLELTELNFLLEFLEGEDTEKAFMEQLRSRVENAVEHLNSTFIECVEVDQDALLQERLDSSLIDEDQEEEVRAETEPKSEVIFLLEESIQDSEDEKIEWLPFLLEDFASHYKEVHSLIDKEESTLVKLSELDVELQKLFEDLDIIDREMAISELCYKSKKAQVEKLQKEWSRIKKSRGIRQRLQARAQNFESKFKKWIN